MVQLQKLQLDNIMMESQKNKLVDYEKERGQEIQHARKLQEEIDKDMEAKKYKKRLERDQAWEVIAYNELEKQKAVAK